MCSLVKSDGILHALHLAHAFAKIVHHLGVAHQHIELALKHAVVGGNVQAAQID